MNLNRDLVRVLIAAGTTVLCCVLVVGCGGTAGSQVVTPVTFSLSGSLGANGAGATVTLSGAASVSTTADGSGNYSFTGLGNGSYTVTPSKNGFTFTPASQNVTINGANQNSVNFTVNGGNTVFFDDFTGTSLSPSWTALSRAGDYSNGELQCYQTANVQVTGGNLVETFKAQTMNCGDATHSPSSFSYTSAMVQWTTFNFVYGTVEVRAKIPNTSLWPAIWMLGANCQASNPQSAGGDFPSNFMGCSWFASGSDEIDIAEFAPNDATARENAFTNEDLYGSNNKFSCGSGPQVGGDGNFHVFTFTRSASSMSWAVDGTTNCTTTNPGLIPTKPMFLIMNIASNSSATPSGLPQTMVVDYVKVTQ